MIIAPIVAPTLTGLTATGILRGIKLKWDALADPTLFGVEVWAASTNNRASATKLATVFDNTFIHSTVAGPTWYYWIRAVSTFGRSDGAWLPVSSTGGTSATALLAQTEDVAASAITAVSLAQSSSALTQTAYSTWEVVFSFTYLGTGNYFIIDAQHLSNLTLATIGTSQSAYAQQRLTTYEHTVYTAGSVTVTNGSPTVTGSGTSWSGTLIAGKLFFLPGGTRYTILSVDSNTQITLTSNYAGATASGQAYYSITATAVVFTLVGPTDKFVINGSYCISYSYPFRYRLPVSSTSGKLYDIFLEWSLVRDNATWSISNSSVLKTIILEEIKR